MSSSLSLSWLELGASYKKIITDFSITWYGNLGLDTILMISFQIGLGLLPTINLEVINN